MPSRRSKTERKLEFATLPTCINGNPGLAGNWRQHLGLAPTHPLVLELGCGRAEFGVRLAALKPNVLVIGIDAKPERLWAGALEAEAMNVHNIRFLREDIENVDAFFGKSEIDEIWITFPDPYPKKRHARRRMTGPVFLQRYRQILKPGGLIQFKTDDPALFDFSVQTLNEAAIPILALTRDLYNDPACLTDETGLPTYYERRFRAEGKPIHYLRFQL